MKRESAVHVWSGLWVFVEDFNLEIIFQEYLFLFLCANFYSLWL